MKMTDTYGVLQDAKMGFLRLALEPDFMTLALQKSLGCAVKLRHIEVKRYKPERRCLIAYTYDDGRETKTVLGKVRAKGLDKTSYETQHYFYKAGLTVPQPLGVIPELQMWLQEKVSGVSLTEIVQEQRTSVLMTCVAKELYGLHQLSPAVSRRHTITDELSILSDRLQRVAAMYPRWSQRLSGVIKGCEQLALALPEISARGIHRDFYPDQVLVADTKFYLLDFDLYTLGDPALDVGNFLGHVTELALRSGDVERFAKLERAFETACLTLNKEVTSQRIGVYKTLTLARHIFISTGFAERRAFTEALLELCERRLSKHEGF